MKSRILSSAAILAITVSVIACNSGTDKTTSDNSSTSSETDKKDASSAENASNPKGTGKFTDVKLTHPLDQSMVTEGKKVYDLKCGSCHKLTDEKLVGPGWKGVTDKRTPEWIMNFVTNTEEMLEKDAEAKKLVEICLVKMPNQSLSDDDARHVLELMRSNDGKN